MPDQVKAEVRLDHKTGPVVITVQAQTPEVAAYMANRIKEIFGSGKKRDAVDDLLRSWGIKP